MRQPRRNVQNPLARAVAAVPATRERRVEKSFRGYFGNSAIVNIPKGLEQHLELAPTAADFSERALRRFCDRLQEIAVRKRLSWQLCFGMQPTIPAMAGRIDTEPCKTAPNPAMMTVLNAGK